jgi:general stress protein 26
MDARDDKSGIAYEPKLREFLSFLQRPEHAVMVLATSGRGRVLARNVLTVTNGTNIYFFTWKYSRKCGDILQNPAVALCRDNVQIEGEATVVGYFGDAAVRPYLELFRKKFPESMNWWEQKPSMVIVQVVPTLVAIGGSVDPPTIEYLNLRERRAYAERWADH